MKFSAALSLGLAHLAVAKSVVRREPSRGEDRDRSRGQSQNQNSNLNQIIASEEQIVELEQLLGLSRGNSLEINLLWVNLGGGAATTVINQVQTVTVTQVLGGTAGVVAPPPAAGAPPPPAGAPAQAPASPTEAVGGTPVAPGIGATHSVVVGGPQGLSFNPEQLVAATGDTVIFTFESNNHTATQSSFDTPCVPLPGGMNTGFQPNPNNTIDPPPQVAMQVMVSTPLWFFCAQNGHCGKGMAFSINPTAAKTHAAFQAAAIAQNGKGTGTAITGNGGGAAAAAPPAPGASSPPAAAVGAGSPLASVPTGSDTNVVTGVGTIGQDGACSCTVSCAAGSFPVAAQGIGSFGGFPGGLPMNAMPAR